MRTYGLRVGAAANLHETPPAGARMIASSRDYRRRLDDAMVAVFDRACYTNNLDAAADVLEVLITWHRRRSTKYGRERRINDDHLKSMLAELKRLTILRRA
jgi:aminoglycoside phosphotransferase (APT) family kinase protein